jgi:hypothetical protein
VSIAVIGVLISLLLPTLSHVRESTRRIICQSNLRQVGLGVAQYADEWDDFLAPSQFYQTDQFNGEGFELAQMMTLRIGPTAGETQGRWDGLGLLYSTFQLRAPEIFYCPSHYGDHAFQNYALDWRIDQPEILGNYHYRGIGPNNAKRLRSVEPVRAALVADGMRTAQDVNHRVGLNVLRADLSVSWFQDYQGEIVELLATSAAQSGEPNNTVLSNVWRAIDRPVSGGSLGVGVGSGQ